MDYTTPKRLKVTYSTSRTVFMGCRAFGLFFCALGFGILVKEPSLRYHRSKHPSEG